MSIKTDDMFAPIHAGSTVSTTKDNFTVKNQMAPTINVSPTSNSTHKKPHSATKRTSAAMYQKRYNY